MVTYGHSVFAQSFPAVEGWQHRSPLLCRLSARRLDASSHCLTGCRQCVRPLPRPGDTPTRFDTPWLGPPPQRSKTLLAANTGPHGAAPGDGAGLAVLLDARENDLPGSCPCLGRCKPRAPCQLGGTDPKRTFLQSFEPLTCDHTFLLNDYMGLSGLSGLSAFSRDFS